MAPSVLAVYGPTNPAKIERHIAPLTESAETTLVCIEAAGPVDGLSYRTVPTFGIRPVGLVLMWVVALDEVLRREYDAVVSFSLFPHGCIALVVGALARLPVHLGVLGIDLDVHATATYGRLVGFLLRRFDVISVPGTFHRRQLATVGVPSERAVVLANAIDADRFVPADDVDPEYDFLWVGRFVPEKQPIQFVRAVAALDDMGLQFRAVMVGDGPQRGAVEAALSHHDLDNAVDLPGWVDDTLSYYQRSKVFVLTSRRDALPLTLLEAMAVGVAPLVPAVGNIADVATDGRNAVVIDDLSAEALADGMARLHRDTALRERLVRHGVAVRNQYSVDDAAEDWADILTIMGVGTPPTESGAAVPA